MNCRVVIVLLLFTPLLALADPRTVTPKEDDSAVLHNPDMGWVLYENYPLDADPHGSSTLLTLPDEPFDGVDAVAIMFSWQDIEKLPDQYDFARVDVAYDYWRKRGKEIQLRLSTASLLWWTHRNAGKGPPDYVLARLPADRKQTRLCEGIPYTCVDARDPFYQQRLKKFLAAVAAHFSNDRPVTLIDLRGFGLWGEWHTGFEFPTLEGRRAALISVIDAYAAGFTDHWLCLSYSYDPDSPKDYRDGPTNRFDAAFTKHYDDFLRYSAFDHALGVPNVTFRRDGAGGAVHSNERKLCDQAFNTLSKGPFVCEFAGGFASSKKGKPGWVEWKIDDALSLHPNYVNLLGWQGADARDFLKQRPELVALGLRTMGYRLVPTKLTLPESVRAGEPFRVQSEWLNRAVGRAMRDYRLRYSLIDAAGKTVASSMPASTGCDRWIKGQVYPLDHAVTFENVRRGDHTLTLTLIDPKTDRPIALPLKGGTDDHAYPIAPLTVRP